MLIFSRQYTYKSLLWLLRYEIKNDTMRQTSIWNNLLKTYAVKVKTCLEQNFATMFINYKSKVLYVIWVYMPCVFQYVTGQNIL